MKSVFYKFNSSLKSIYELDGSSANRIFSMEGLRGFAVILVFFVHYHALFSTRLDALSMSYKISRFLEINGNSGVDLFFVLSGYLIYGAVIKRKLDFKLFLRRRVERIYPTFLVVFAVYLAVSFISPEKNRIPADFGGAIIYLLQNILLLPGIFDIVPLITVAWSLSYEFFYYLFLPVIVAVFALRSKKPSYRVVFFSAVTVICIIYSFIGDLPNMKLLMFVSGILLYEAVKNFQLHTKVSTAFEYLVAAMVLISFFLIYFLLNMPETSQIFSAHLKNVLHLLILFVTFFLLVLACIGAKAILNTIFCWSPLRWLGNMSYSYYLIHGFTLHIISLFVALFFADAFASPLVFWLSMPVFFMITWISSTLLFMFVEKPLSLKPIQMPQSIFGIRLSSSAKI